MAHPFLERLARGVVLADGGMGTMLHAQGAEHDRSPAEFNLTQPDWVRGIHLSYIAAGADLIETNSFRASRPRLAEFGQADKVREVNFRAVKLAREAREVSGEGVWIAGAIGPLGRRAHHRDGTLNQDLAVAAFEEQIAILWEAGADLLIFETFSDLEELSTAIQIARSSSDLPIIAQMTFGNEGLTGSGDSPAEAAARLMGLGVDVAGVNCSMGPARVLDTVAEMHRAAPLLHLSAMPNAGLPFRSGERLVYPSAPTYFAQHVSQFLAAGVAVLGGCCGTTPAHIRAMRLALQLSGSQGTGSGRSAQGAGQGKQELTQEVGAGLTLGELQAVPMVRASTPFAVQAEDSPEPSGFLRKLQAGEFVTSVEVDPPRGFSAAKMLEGARTAREHGADAVNVADSPMARVRMSALALCVLIQDQVGIESVLHFTTRDRSLMGLQADLIGAHALGIRNIIALTGDPPSLGDQPDSTPVYDVDSIGLVKIISQFNAGNDLAGKPFGSRSAFTVIVACDPTRPDIIQEVDRFHRKVSNGAHLTMTQPVYDPAVWQRFHDLYEERHGPFPVPVLIGILPLQSYRHATFLHNEVPGITLPEEALARMERAGSDGRREGVRMARELLLQMKEMPRVRGVYLMPSFGRYEVACEVLDVV